MQQHFLQRRETHVMCTKIIPSYFDGQVLPSYYRGQDCMGLFTRMCGTKNPENLRSTHLRKHIATLSQILNLKNNELDQLAKFLGHNIQVHRDFYHLPEATIEVAKIYKLLLALEKGTLGEFQGKSLDEI